MTFHWDRYYDPDALVHTMEQVFPQYHTRTCLIALVSSFEVTISEFWNRLEELGKSQAKGRNDLYKSRLDWAFDRVRVARFGGPEMISRIPPNCRRIDHARRLRNIFLHHDGLLNKKYMDDGIPIQGKVDGVSIDEEWQKDSKQKIAISLSPEAFLEFYRAHLEILHQLHDVLQGEDFNETSSYSYLVATNL